MRMDGRCARDALAAWNRKRPRPPRPGWRHRPASRRCSPRCGWPAIGSADRRGGQIVCLPRPGACAAHRRAQGDRRHARHLLTSSPASRSHATTTPTAGDRGLGQRAQPGVDQPHRQRRGCHGREGRHHHQRANRCDEVRVTISTQVPAFRRGPAKAVRAFFTTSRPGGQRRGPAHQPQRGGAPRRQDRRRVGPGSDVLRVTCGCPCRRTARHRLHSGLGRKYRRTAYCPCVTANGIDLGNYTDPPQPPKSTAIDHDLVLLSPGTG